PDLDDHRAPDDYGGAVLRRAGGDDAGGRGPVRLPSRGLLSPLGVPVRLDAVPGDPDRHDRGRGGRLRALSRRAVPVDLADSLDRRADQSVAGVRRPSLGPAAGGGSDDTRPDLDQYTGPAS